MHSFNKNGIDITEWVIVTSVTYPLFSKTNKYIKRAEETEEYNGNFKTSKLISVTMLLKDLCKFPIELQHQVEKFIIEKLYTRSTEWIEIDGRYTNVILEDVDDGEMYQGIITVTYKSLSGNWFTEEKTKEINGVLNYKGIESTKYFKMELTPTTNKVQIGHSESGENFIIKPKSTIHKIYVSFEDKTVIQNDAHAPIDIQSNFFELKVGSNTFSCTGASGVIKYREVLA
ncbi:hypothetical protein ABGF49_07705 [Helcococcus ovis]|uniref:phage distal tail protein n=1 Tax=Helcococcus TaxID=31983 RepID=UPI0038B963E8